jgi:hypothetical protein
MAAGDDASLRRKDVRYPTDRFSGVVFGHDGEELHRGRPRRECGRDRTDNPIWMPVNVILIRALLNFYAYYGNTYTIECPTGSGRLMNLFEVAKEISDRLTRIFLRDGGGRRPVHGGTKAFQDDVHWRDHILFYEYFHGDNGAGLGASHQTGWTGAVAKLIQLFGMLDAEQVLKAGETASFGRGSQVTGATGA